MTQDIREQVRARYAAVAVPSCFIATWTRPRTVVSEKSGPALPH